MEVPLAPQTPIDREIYVQHGFPWFDYYDADREDLAASETLSKVKTVGDLLGKDEKPFRPVDPSTVIKLKDGGAATVAPGVW